MGWGTRVNVGLSFSHSFARVQAEFHWLESTDSLDSFKGQWVLAGYP